MNVRLNRSVNVEFEATIDIDDMVNEFFQRLEEEGDDQETRRTIGPMIHCITSLLESVTDVAIQKFPPDVKLKIRNLLKRESERWQE